jgi:hypothetical protein
MRLFLPFLLALAAAIPPVAAAETQNGLQVTVSPKTISRNDTRYAYYFTDRAINRMMALQITTKNVSMRAFPEGTLEWKILVIGTSGGTPTLYSGTEKLPALKTSASHEVLVGSAQITGWRDASYQRKDKLEHQIVIKHDGKETVRTASTPSFDSIATHAYKKPATTP